MIQLDVLINYIGDLLCVILNIVRLYKLIIFELVNNIAEFVMLRNIKRLMLVSIYYKYNINDFLVWEGAKYVF